MDVFLATNQKLVLEPVPFASGGQGDIYRFDRKAHPKLRLRIAKILRTGHNTADYESRIQFQQANRPAMANLPNPDCLAWPEHCLYNRSGQFVGFIQPFIGGAVELEHLCNLQGTKDVRFARFSGPFDTARMQRLRIGRSLVDALDALESSGRYLSTDLKPTNILVKPTAEISLIDLDNLQIVDGGQVLFHATGFTDEYTPPEFLQGKISIKIDQIHKSFERFSMAVILYRLLFGIHPFMGTSIASDLLDAIRHGYFPNGPHRDKFSVIPPPHDKFKTIDASLQDLFRQAFDDGSSTDLRPSARDWATALDKLGVRSVAASPHHVRAAWAARHGIPIPAASTFQHWERASIWNPCPEKRAGYSSEDLFIDPEPIERVSASDSGVRLDAIIHDIWMAYAFDATIVGKRVLLSYFVSPSMIGYANFAGEGWLGRDLPPQGSCVRDVYGPFVFRLSAHPRNASFFSRERHVLRHIELLVDVPTYSIKSKARSKFIKPSALDPVRPIASWLMQRFPAQHFESVPSPPPPVPLRPRLDSLHNPAPLASPVALRCPVMCGLAPAVSKARPRQSSESP